MRTGLEAAQAPAPGTDRPLGRIRPCPPHFTKYKLVQLLNAASDFNYFKCAWIAQCVCYSRGASVEHLKPRGHRLRGRIVLLAPDSTLSTDRFTTYKFDAASDFKNFTCVEISKCLSCSRHACAERSEPRGLRLRLRLRGQIVLFSAACFDSLHPWCKHVSTRLPVYLRRVFYTKAEVRQTLSENKADVYFGAFAASSPQTRIRWQFVRARTRRCRQHRGCSCASLNCSTRHRRCG